MRLAVSNIGWNPEHSGVVLPRLKDHAVEGLVIAPTMVWPEAPRVSADQAKSFRAQVADEGLVIAGMQSLTFGLKDAALTGEDQARRRMTEHLKRHAELAGHLGAASLIFGSPGVRRGVDVDQASAIFEEVARVASDNGAKLCIEPLSGYNNEFVTTTAAGIELVQRIREMGTDGFGLHLDSAAIAGTPEPTPELDILIASHLTGIHSFDASAPELMSPSADTTVDHGEMAAALRLVGYTGFVSLEMRGPQAEDPVGAFMHEVDFVRSRYQL